MSFTIQKGHLYELTGSTNHDVYRVTLCRKRKMLAAVDVSLLLVSYKGQMGN